MAKKVSRYRTAPIRKIGKDYYRLWGTVGTKRLAEWEIRRFKADGTKYRVERWGEGYRIWYCPGTQDVVKRDYERLRRGEY